MPLSEEEELNDLFEDVLRIARTPENAKSALRNFLHDKRTEAPPLCCVCASDLNMPGSSPTDSSCSVSTVSTIAVSPGPTSVQRVTIPSTERHRSATRTSHHIPSSRSASRTSHQIPSSPSISGTSLQIPSPRVNTSVYILDPPKPTSSRTIGNSDRVVPSTHPSSPEQGYEHVCLDNPMLDQITASESQLSSTAFRYIRYKISEDQFYLGEVERNHYRIRGMGYSQDKFSVPENTHTAGPFYAITCGRAVGIYVDWFNEARHLVEGCPGNFHKSFKIYRDAVLFTQTALLLGRIEVVPA